MLRFRLTVLVLMIHWLTVWAEDYSGTLPVMYINTEDTIASKTKYVNATYYIDALGSQWFQNIGSKEAPLTMQIKGHGNYTWTNADFVKKSYRITLDEKAPLMGLNSNKHFILLAHFDGENGFLRNASGFWLSRELGLDYTPAEQPVEVVLNGRYAGLYFLTEKIRIERYRLNIAEQPDGETDDELITGGWLVEIDNANDSHQIKFSVAGTDLGWLWITYHSPEVLSTKQRNYLREQINEIKRTVYTDDKESTEWEDIIDVSQLTRYYMVYEVIDHLEGFLGSCYLHKNRYDSHWKFGPVWDMGHAFNGWHDKNRFMYDYDGWSPCIIAEIAKFPRFQEEVRRVWQEFYPEKLRRMVDYMRLYAQYIEQAALCDSRRWGVKSSADVYKTLETCYSRLFEKVEFLRSQWGDGAIDEQTDKDTTVVKPHIIYNIKGQRLSEKPRHGVYIIDGKKYVR